MKKCYRTACALPSELLLWVNLPCAAALGLRVASQEHACELHAIEDDDAGHVRRAIRVGVKA